MKNKFAELLSSNHNQIRESRATIIAEKALYAQEEIVRRIQGERRDLRSKLLDLTDMHPDSRLSLRVTKEDFDPKATFEEIQSVKVDLANKQVEVEITESTFAEWFGEEKEVTSEKD